MHNNRIWWLFLSCFVAATLYYASLTSLALGNFFHFSYTGKAAVSDVSIQQEAHNQYALTVSYDFYFKGNPISKKEKLEEKFYSPWSAEIKKKKLLTVDQKVFLAENSKGELSSKLSLSFPFKLLSYTLVLLITTIYLFFLGRKVARYNKNLP
ncbi:MAG: hypothetical protein GWP59_02845 [Chlamydiales bacterium]|nr:hypothetical protein [Chlamydiales bacterium]